MNREVLLALIEANLPRGFTVSKDLPYSSSGEPLYVKNLKRIYVDQVTSSQEPVVTLLNGSTIDAQVNTYTVFFAVDAKTTNIQAHDVARMLVSLKYQFASEYFRRTASSTMEFSDDICIYTITYETSKLI